MNASVNISKLNRNTVMDTYNPSYVGETDAKFMRQFKSTLNGSAHIK